MFITPVPRYYKRMIFSGNHLRTICEPSVNLNEVRDRGAPRLAAILSWSGCLGVFIVLQDVFSLFAFASVGGAFHAMFAYSDVGRPSMAIEFSVCILAACLLTNCVLQFFRAGVPVWGLALLGAIAAFFGWSPVVEWSNPVSVEFRDLAKAIQLWLPVACFGSSFVVRLVGRRLSQPASDRGGQGVM